MNTKLVVAFICLTSAVPSKADIQFGKDRSIHFASAKEGKQILTARDDFIRRLSPFDRSARLKVDRPVSEGEFLEFVGKNVADWKTDEIEKVQGALEQLRSPLSDLALSFPATIQLIKTTGAEEGNAAYTRATAIVIPDVELSKSQSELEKLICHELFHILSRQNSQLREQLYGAIGFAPCDEIEFPQALASRKITNPDAPRNDHFIRLQNKGQDCLAIPILFSSAETYDVKRRGEFFDYLTFQFLVVKAGSGLRNVTVVYEDSRPKLLDPREVSGFLEQIGRNTQYVIHPEEILADNFALLIVGEPKPASPEILQKMKDILFRKTGV